MKYILLIYAEEAAWTRLTPEQQKQSVAAYGAYTEALNAAGVRVASDRLRPIATATSVRAVNGETKVLDGPYAESKEQLGGFYMIDVPDLDTALSWAARCPAVEYGTMEVRPIWEMY
jgi:hypothetical protein